MARIKINAVMAEVEATRIASLELKAPLGVDVDLKTGELSKMIRVEAAGDPILRQTVIPGKLITDGFLKASFAVEGHELATELYLPIYSVTKIKEIMPNDEVTTVAKLEHISISGLPEVVPVGRSGYQVKLFVRGILDLMITVTREDIISLPEVETPPPMQEAPKKTGSGKRQASNNSSRYNTWTRYWAHMHR